MNNQEAALLLAEEGLPVFPCRSHKERIDGKDYDEKSPYPKNGFKDASTSVKQITSWWQTHPDALLGVPTGYSTRLLVVDVDPDGAQWYRDNAERLECARVHKTRRGHHLVYRMPHGIEIKNSASKIAPGIDVRAEGGYIIWWPASGLEATGSMEELTLPPKWLLEELTAARKKTSNAAAEPSKPKAASSNNVVSIKSGPIPEGSRNHTLYHYACSLRAKGITDEAAWELLQERNTERCRPPLDEGELRTLFDSAWKHPAGFHLTDLGNAERLVAQHGEDIRYIAGAGWANYENHRWNTEHARPRVMVMMANVVRHMYVEAAREEDDAARRQLVGHAKASESRSKIESAVALAEWQPGVADRLENYDTNNYLIGLQNGVYDLERDEFREGRRDDRITLQANVAFDPMATAPRWKQFQEEIHDDKTEIIEFKQRSLGYTLSGDTSEQVLFLPYGDGANGKSTEQNVLLHLMGGYGRKIQPETLLVRKQGGSTNDVARMRGARFVATVEVEDGGRLAESLVKQLTGQDRIAARFLYQEFFEFQPLGKIWLATNHKPEIVGTTHAIWRRILLVPYPVQFDADNRDPRLEEKLRGELPGILNWMIEGFRKWRKDGLLVPEEIRGQNDAYRQEMDRIGSFLNECAKFGDAIKPRTRASKVYQEYRAWARSAGLLPLSARRFHAHMAKDHKLTRVSGDAGPDSDYPNFLLVTHYYEETSF